MGLFLTKTSAFKRLMLRLNKMVNLRLCSSPTHCTNNPRPQVGLPTGRFLPTVGVPTDWGGV